MTRTSTRTSPDPPTRRNACYAHERAWPEGYAELKGGWLGHLHVRTSRSTRRARRSRCGRWARANQFEPVAKALAADGYDGVVSFESVYHPGDGNFEAGFRACIGRFKEIFG